MRRQITTFSVGDSLLGLDILIVKEVYRNMELTPIPDAPKHMSGLMNLRGRIVTVIDLNECLNISTDKSDRILLILKTQSEIQQYQNQGYLAGIDLYDDIVGFLIGSMEEVLDVEDNEILPTPPNLSSIDRHLVYGVVKLKKQLVLLLDINAVLERITNLATGRKKHDD